jgi:hypothetical protein
MQSLQLPPFPRQVCHPLTRQRQLLSPGVRSLRPPLFKKKKSRPFLRTRCHSDSVCQTNRQRYLLLLEVEYTSYLFFFLKNTRKSATQSLFLAATPLPQLILQRTCCTNAKAAPHTFFFFLVTPVSRLIYLRPQRQRPTGCCCC